MILSQTVSKYPSIRTSDKKMYRPLYGVEALIHYFVNLGNDAKESGGWAEQNYLCSSEFI